MDKLDSMIHHVHSPLTKFVTNILVHCTVPGTGTCTCTVLVLLVHVEAKDTHCATSGRDHKENHNTSKNQSINNKIINNNTNHLTL